MADRQDFFYLCAGHTKDRGFCSPIVDEAEVAAKKRKADLDKEIGLIKKEYEDKLEKRKKRKAEKQNGDSKDDKAKDKAEDEATKDLTREKDEKV